MRVVMGNMDAKKGAGNSAARSALGRQGDFFRKAEGLDCILEEGERHPQIEESCGKHVPADTGGAIEMQADGGHSGEDRLTQSRRIYRKKR